MRQLQRSTWSFALLSWIAFFAASAHAEPVSASKLPEPVANTFNKEFPKASIEKVDAEEEGGVMVYDFEFRQGKVEKETDISADGTMLEFTTVVKPEAVPEPAMKAIRATAQGAKIGRLEHIDIRYETKDGQVIQLPELVTHYAAEMTKGKQKAEVVVRPDGSLVDAPLWVPADEKKSAENSPK